MGLFIGVCRVDFRIPGSSSLKDKRRVVKSIKERLKTRYNISIAEVGALEKRQRAELGIACIGSDQPRINSILTKVLDKIRSDPRISVIDIELDIS